MQPKTKNYLLDSMKICLYAFFFTKGNILCSNIHIYICEKKISYGYSYGISIWCPKIDDFENLELFVIKNVRNECYRRCKWTIHKFKLEYIQCLWKINRQKAGIIRK